MGQSVEDLSLNLNYNVCSTSVRYIKESTHSIFELF